MYKIFFVVFCLCFSFIVCAKEVISVCLSGHIFSAQVASSVRDRARGLMYKKALARDNAMLFVFDKEGEHSFWMKNTLLPLDILWLNGQKKIVYIKENFQPCQGDFCPKETPSAKAKYALEVNAGIVKELDVKLGDSVDFI